MSRLPSHPIRVLGRGRVPLPAVHEEQVVSGAVTLTKARWLFHVTAASLCYVRPRFRRTSTPQNLCVDSEHFRRQHGLPPCFVRSSFHGVQRKQSPRPLSVVNERVTLLCRDGRPALAAACGKDRATSARAHTQPETMLLGATTIIRLEGPLTHGKSPLVGVR